MSKIRLFQVDAFTDKLFGGNPAAVCILKSWLSDELMQSIAAENNLAETAFVVSKGEIFQIRWFTPAVEVDLCGHATLAAAFVLFKCLNYNQSTITFQSSKSGNLRVSLNEELLFLDFPTDSLTPNFEFDQIEECLGVKPLEIYKGKTDYIALLENESIVVDMKPDMQEVVKLHARGLIITAKGDEVDFVSRFFGPKVGINEDPVTGSAHTSLIPLWSKKLAKKEMVAQQLSPRKGSLVCIENGDRCLIGGNAKLYMTGEIEIEE